jgi:hypothetical protein
MNILVIEHWLFNGNFAPKVIHLCYLRCSFFFHRTSLYYLCYACMPFSELPYESNLLQACEVLSKPQKSLAYLLELYCGVTTDKTMQREDWRLRPLTPEMIQYARCDAHYLLYIANCLASELHAKTYDASDSPNDKINFFFEASHRSNMVCMQLYAKEIECPPGASSAASILSKNLQSHGLDSYKSSEVKDLVWKICAWRDLMVSQHILILLEQLIFAFS